MDWLVETIRNNPSLAVFLTIGVGFFIGRLKYKSFSLGTVTSVLLVGVLVGQLDIPISGPMKNVFFLMFLFAIGYSVGPQFFASLKGEGLKQVGFAVIVCLLCLLTTWGCAKIMHYNIGEAIGMFAGAQTISAVIGVGTDTMQSLSASPETKKAWVDIIPVSYAVCYVFGTIGSAYLLANLGPVLLGGLKKVKEHTQALEKELNQSSIDSDPAYINANRPVAFRAYKVSSDFFDQPRSVSEVEGYLAQKNRRLFVERIRHNGSILAPDSTVTIGKGDEIVLSGRRESIIGDEGWIGDEVADNALLNFPAEQISVLVTKKGAAGMTVDQLRSCKYMYGVTIKSIRRGDVSMPVLAQFKLSAGDTLEIVGLPNEVEAASKAIGYADRPTNVTDLVFVGLGLFFGALFGAITIHFGNVPVTLSTSGGALIAGLVLGWYRTKRPTFGHIPQPAVWLMNNLGLNMFIAVIGITSGPSFVSGLKEVGFVLFFMGMISTSLPLILGVIIGKKIFKFPDPVNLGCCAGARTTTASLGAIQEAIGSTIPAMGYTVTYVVGNTLLILCGVALVLMVGA